MSAQPDPGDYLYLVAPAVRVVVARTGRRDLWEELWSEGLVALVECARLYDPDRGASFATWARAKLPYLLFDWLRLATGRRGPRKAHDGAESLEAPGPDTLPPLDERLADPAPSPEDQVVRDLTTRELVSWYRERLEELNPRSLEIATRHFRGETLASIARRWGVDESRVFQIEDQLQGRLHRRWARERA